MDWAVELGLGLYVCRLPCPRADRELSPSPHLLCQEQGPPGWVSGGNRAMISLQAGKHLAWLL